MKNLYFLMLLLCCSSFVYGEPPQKPFFTLQQEKFLALNLPVYAYFSQLYVNKKTPAQIAQEYHLSERTTHNYLKALEDIGLIKKGKEDTLSSPVHFSVTGVSTYSSNGPLNNKLAEQILNETHEKLHFLLTTKSKDFYLSSPGLWLTEKDYEAYKKELAALEEKYIDVSVKNKTSKNKDAFRVWSFTGLIPHWEPPLFNDVKKDY